MANNKRPTLTDAWREKIQVSLLIKRLYENGLGEKELDKTQQKSIEILLRKLVPDLKAIEMYGKDGGAIEVKNVSENDKAIIKQFLNNQKGVKSEL